MWQLGQKSKWFVVQAFAVVRCTRKQGWHFQLIADDSVMLNHGI